MVNVSSQSNKVNITVSSSGVSSNVNASGDTSHYYSEKAREWAISNRMVDGVDYSSKYYAEKSNQSALNAQSFAQSAQDSYKQFQNSVDGALSNIDSSVQGAITTIDTKSGEAIETINNSADDVIEDINKEFEEVKQELDKTIENVDNLLKEVDEKLDNIATDLNSKADTDLVNLTPQGKSLIANYAMPSGKYIDLEWGASGTIYTAPANGWFFARGGAATSVNAYHDIVLAVGGTTSITATYLSTGQLISGNTVVFAFIPVKKGQQVTLLYYANLTREKLIRFIYAEGSESEAE